MNKNKLISRYFPSKWWFRAIKETKVTPRFRLIWGGL